MKKLVEALEKELELIRTDFTQVHEIREKMLALARKINQSSREAIESIHGGELEAAKEFLKSAFELNGQMADMIESHPALYPSVYAAQKELVEAATFQAIYTKSEIPSRDSLRVTNIAYLNGLREAIGELSRWMGNSTTGKNIELVKEIFNLINKITTLVRSFSSFPDAITANSKKERDDTMKIRGARERDLGIYLRDVEKKEREEKLIVLLSKDK